MNGKMKMNILMRQRRSIGLEEQGLQNQVAVKILRRLEAGVRRVQDVVWIILRGVRNANPGIKMTVRAQEGRKRGLNVISVPGVGAGGQVVHLVVVVIMRRTGMKTRKMEERYLLEERLLWKGPERMRLILSATPAGLQRISQICLWTVQHCGIRLK